MVNFANAWAFYPLGLYIFFLSLKFMKLGLVDSALNVYVTF